MKKSIVILIGALLMLSACVGPFANSDESDPTASQTNVVADEPTAGIEAVTDTPLPPSETPTTEVTVTNTPTPEPSPTPEPYGPDNFPTGVNPLTGMVVADPDLLERRPLAVKIQLYPRNGRPPWGIALADIVFDYYQNDGLTRLNSVFYGNDAETVGPIRSARLFDEHIMRMYEAIFAFGGADWRVVNRIYDADLVNRMVVEGANNCPPMCRLEPNGPNYLVTNTQELGEYAESEKGVDNTRQDLNGMSFDLKTPEGGVPGEQIEVRWSISAYVQWVYDQESGRYQRFQDALEAYSGEEEQFDPFMDRLTEEQITAANVVVLPLVHEDIFPERNIEVIDIKLSGSGEAYLFRDGQMFKVQWNRPASDSLIFLTDAEGNRIPFKPGNTWFEVVGASSLVSEPESGTWRYEMRFP